MVRMYIYELQVIVMNIEAYDAESLRKLVRLLEYENRILKEKLKKENIPYDEVNPFEETIDNVEEYVGRLNRDYEGKEAVYVYDYIDAHMRFFNKMYGKRLKTYKKTGFSIWTEDEQTKQIINAIYDSGNYTEKFEQDIVEAEKSIVISSPDIRQNKIDRLLSLVKDRQEKGVNVTVITTDPDGVVYGSEDVCYELIREMRQVGINVVTKAEVEERFAVIDEELVWHGGMNLLGKVDVWDNLMRIKNYQVAAELLEIALGVTSDS